MVSPAQLTPANLANAHTRETHPSQPFDEKNGNWLVDRRFTVPAGSQDWKSWGFQFNTDGLVIIDIETKDQVPLTLELERHSPGWFDSPLELTDKMQGPDFHVAVFSCHEGEYYDPHPNTGYNLKAVGNHGSATVLVKQISTNHKVEPIPFIWKGEPGLYLFGPFQNIHETLYLHFDSGEPYLIKKFANYDDEQEIIYEDQGRTRRAIIRATPRQWLLYIVADGDWQMTLSSDSTHQQVISQTQSPRPNNLQTAPTASMEFQDTPQGIAGRVQFWEEQDKINQVLIPRVLRQHELLVDHVREHDNLPELLAKATHNATQEVQASFKKTMDEALEQQEQTFSQTISQLEARHQADLDQQRQEYAVAQQQQKETFDQAAEQLKAQHESDLARQKQEYADARAQDRKARNILIAVTAVSVAAGISGLLYNLLG